MQICMCSFTLQITFFTFTDSVSDVKTIYFANSDPKNVGKRSFDIKRFDKNIRQGLWRTYDVDYFMTSKLCH